MSAPGGCILSIASAAPVGTVSPRYFIVGNMIRFQASITDITGVAADPTTVVFTVGTSYLDEVTLTTVHDGVGQYHADWDTTSAPPGSYYCDVVGTGSLLVAAEVPLSIQALHL